MTNRNFLLPLSLLTTLALGGWLAFSLQANPHVGQPTTVPEANLLKVNVIELVGQDNYERSRIYTGVVKESQRSSLGFLGSGELIEILVDEGDAVKGGQVLARLDTRHVLAQRDRIVAQLAEANALLAELVAGPRLEVISAKRAELRATQASKESLQKQVARRGTLVNSNTVSREEFEIASFDLAATKAEVERLESQLDELLAGTRQEQINAQLARVAQLQAELADVEHDLADAVIRAPYDGRITRRLIDEGTILRSGEAVLELVDDTHLEAWIGLPMEASDDIALGESFSLQVSGKRVTGVVVSLSPEIDKSTRTRRVRLRIGSATQLGVLPGQVVRLSVCERVAEQGFWVPTAALAKGARGLWALYAVSNEGQQSTASRRDVELLDTTGEQSYIRGSVEQGELVIAEGIHRIVAGQKVEPVSRSIGSSIPPEIAGEL